MHLKDEELRAYLDRELPAAKTADARSHLDHCAACAGRLEAIRARAGLVQARMSRLAPGPRQGAGSPKTAFQQAIRQPKEQKNAMSNKRTLLGAVTVLLALVLVFTITPASAWANSFLDLFRVQKVTVVQFNPGAMKQMQQSLSGQREAIENIFDKNFEYTERGELKTVDSVQAAEQEVGFMPQQVGQPDAVLVKPGVNAKLTIDQPQFQAIIDAAGLDTQLPPSVDGKVVTFDVPASVITEYGDCPTGADPTEMSDAQLAGCTVLMQVLSPTVNAPDELDVPAMGQAVFRFLGMPAGQAASLSESIDWTSTLVLPIPSGRGITDEEITVDGVTATLLTSNGDPDAPSPRYALIWTKNGILSMLTGPGSKADALQAISQLK